MVKEPDGSAFGDFLNSIIQYDPKGLFDLVEVRMSLEIQSVTLAARRAGRAGLAAIENRLEAMRHAAADMKSGDDPDGAEKRYHDADIGFHEALALASGNRVLTYLFEAMASPLQESFFMTRRGHEMRGHTPEHTIAAHQTILNFVREGNSKGAAEAMRTPSKMPNATFARRSAAAPVVRGAEASFGGQKREISRFTFSMNALSSASPFLFMS